MSGDRTCLGAHDDDKHDGDEKIMLYRAYLTLKVAT